MNGTLTETRIPELHFFAADDVYAYLKINLFSRSCIRNLRDRSGHIGAKTEFNVKWQFAYTQSAYYRSFIAALSPEWENLESFHLYTCLTPYDPR